MCRHQRANASFSCLITKEMPACCHHNPCPVQSSLHSSAPVGYIGSHPYTMQAHMSHPHSCSAMWAAVYHVTDWPAGTLWSAWCLVVPCSLCLLQPLWTLTPGPFKHRAALRSGRLWGRLGNTVSTLSGEEEQHPRGGSRERGCWVTIREASMSG